MLIRLAGLVTIEHDGAPPRYLSSAQAQIAFARMTLERAGGTSRDQLADSLWPDGLPDTWASALRSVVSRVRAFVACAQLPGEAPLVAQAGRYLLRFPAGTVIDLECAEARVSDAVKAFDENAFAESQRLAMVAVSCLERPLLPNHEGEWVNGVRERMSELLVSALETASLAASARHDERNALRFADEAVRRAPLRESAYRCRMSAHVAAGNRAEALRSYQQLRRMLAEELGVDPAPETQAAYVDLLGSPVAAGRTQRLDHSRSRSAAPFVGRRAELSVLAQAWSQAQHGTSHMILVTGEPGVGKTRLVTEAARRISLAGGVVMYGRCDHGSIVPCQPFVEALGGFLAATPEDSMPELSRATRETLAAVVAGHRDPVGAVTASTRAELLLTLTDLLVRVARDRSVFLVLDDLDLADNDTLVLLHQLFRRRTGTSLLVVATVGAPAQRRDQVAVAIHDIDREGWLHRLALRGLAEPDVGALVRQVLGETSAGNAPPSRRLVADTAGNAYLLLELLGGRASGIEEYVSARLAALEPAARRLLRTAAAAGPSFELDMIAEAAQLDTDRSMESLEALVANEMVTEVRTTASGRHVHQYRFTHDVLRRAIYGQFSTAHRRLLHTRLADAIERRRPGDLSRYSRILAHHRATGAEPHGDQRAVRWGWRAAAHATREGEPEEAVRLHRQALDHVPAADHELRAEALTKLGLALLAAGHAECEQIILDGAILALHNARLSIAAQAALGLADAVVTRPRLRSEAVALIELLVRAAQDHPTRRDSLDSIDDVTLGRLLARQYQLGLPVPAGTMAATAVNALALELRLLEGPDYVQRRLTLAAEMLTLATAVNDRHARIVAAHHHAMAAEMAGDYPARQQALAALSSAVGDVDGGLFGDALLVDHAVAVAVTQGRFADALVTTRLAGAGHAGHGIAPLPGSLAARQMFIAGWLCQSPWPRVDGRFPTTCEAAERLLTTLVGGDRGRPHLTVRALATGAEPLPSGDEWPHIVGLLALGGVELGDPTTAEAVRTLLTPYPDLVCGVGYRSFVGPVSFHLGRLAVIVGDWDEAERQLTSALAQLASRQARPWTALAQLALAQALQARGRAGDRRSADALRADAHYLLAGLGLQHRSRDTGSAALSPSASACSAAPARMPPAP